MCAGPQEAGTGEPNSYQSTLRVAIMIAATKANSRIDPISSALSSERRITKDTKKHEEMHKTS